MKYFGKIINILANFYYVIDKENKIWECFARARLLKEGKLLHVGDELEFEESNATQGVIVDLKERKNKIAKPPVANVDQVVVVFSTCEPDFDLYNLDRYLSIVRYELSTEDIVICVNKIDLKKINIDEVYKKSGFKVFYVSALTKEGLDKLANQLVSKTTVLTGPSGVGKSSLINALVPGSNIKIEDLGHSKKGKHTTRNVSLISFAHQDQQGYLVDTPGFTQINFVSLNPNKILLAFKELNNLGCSFANCLHEGEEGCVIEKSVSSKLLCESRYHSYLRILTELKSEKIYGTKQETKAKLVGGGKEEKIKVIPKIGQEDRAKSRKKQKQEISKLEIESDN